MSKKNRFSFSLRFLLIVTLIAALFFGSLGRRFQFIRHQRAAVKRLEEIRSRIEWNAHPGIVSRLFGGELFQDVTSVWIRRRPYLHEDDLELIGRLRYLKKLKLEETPFDSAGLQHLSQLANLETLEITNAKIVATGLTGLVGPKGLTTLTLSQTNIDDGGVSHITQQFLNLESLNLSNTQITDIATPALSRLKNLETLVLTNNRLTPDGIKKLKKCRTVSTLVLNNTVTDDQCLRVLSQLRELQELHLRFTKISDEGLTHLEKVKQLRNLSIGGTQISDAGLKTLANFPELRKLDISGAHITDTGLGHLLDVPLELLLAQYTNATAAGVLRFLDLPDDVRNRITLQMGEDATVEELTRRPLFHTWSSRPRIVPYSGEKFCKY